MSEWCKCGHGSGWHQPPYGEAWKCHFDRCECQKFDDRYPAYDSCERCGHPYHDWMGNKHDDDFIHGGRCACKEFVWRKREEPPDPNTKRVIDL